MRWMPSTTLQKDSLSRPPEQHTRPCTHVTGRMRSDSDRRDREAESFAPATVHISSDLRAKIHTGLQVSSHRARSLAFLGRHGFSVTDRMRFGANCASCHSSRCQKPASAARSNPLCTERTNPHRYVFPAQGTVTAEVDILNQ